MIAMDTVPAEPSSWIPAALSQLAHAGPLRPVDAPGLLAYLAAAHDPRRASGRRHPLVAILAMAAAAVLAGARSMTAIAEWAADTPSRCGPRSAPAVTPPTGWVVLAEATIPPGPGPGGPNGAGRGDRCVAFRP
jgi:hypothetical protein